MKTTMKALNLHAIDDLRLDTLPVPTVGEDEVLVKIAYCGVCGSDIPRVYSKGTYHFPTVIGHEFSGVVAYDPKGELDGKRVAVFPLLPCFTCDSCKQESYALCADYDYYGSHQQCKRVPFSPPSPAFIACRFLDRSHSDWCEVVPHCGFDLHFSNNE